MLVTAKRPGRTRAEKGARRNVRYRRIYRRGAGDTHPLKRPVSYTHLLPELAQAGTKRFLLAHLSRENNTPSLAREAALSSLCGAGLSQGTDFWLGVAPVENQEGKAIIF